MKIVMLAGELGAKFGREWHLDVNSPAEAIRAIAANQPGFIAHLAESGQRGVAYAVALDNAPLEETNLSAPFGHETLHIVPVVAGAKSGFGAILGIAMIALSFYLPVTPLISGFSFSLSSIAANIGLSMVLGGVSQMLAGTPAAPSQQAAAESAGTPSYFFNGPTSNAGQGSPVPVGYGKVLVPGLPVSGGISSNNVQTY